MVYNFSSTKAQKNIYHTSCGYSIKIKNLCISVARGDFQIFFKRAFPWGPPWAVKRLRCYSAGGIKRAQKIFKSPGANNVFSIY